jgi:uncharacterized protein (DUF2236 family)
MEFIRRHIETQVMSLTGLSLGKIDLENPKGDPGLFGPNSICWQVHGDYSSMLIGGISALMLQALHPLALAGIWDHSTFREDMIGRLRRTGLFISGTTFSSRHDAEWLIEKVRSVHMQITGTAVDGRPYAASDPVLLTWVHVAEVSSFLSAHLRYKNSHLSLDDQDRYYDETASIAERLGAEKVPRSRREISDYLEQMRPQLLCDSRSREVLSLLLAAPSPSRLARPFGTLMMQAGIDLLPYWASEMFDISPNRLKSKLVRASIKRSLPVLRWAVRNCSLNRARRRMGLTE